MFESGVASLEDYLDIGSPASNSRTEEEIEENTPILLNKIFSNYSDSPASDFSLLTPDNTFQCSNNYAVCFESSKLFTLTQIIIQGTDQENSLQEALLWISSKPLSIENMKKTFFVPGSNEKLFKNMKRTNEQEPLLFIKIEKFSKFNFKFKPKYPTGKFVGLLFLEPEGHLEIDNIQFIGFESTKRFSNIENVDEEKIAKSFQSNLCFLIVF
jgi:hypothetical protein